MAEKEHASIEARLRQAWRQQRRYVHLRGAARFAIWAIAMILVSFLIDWGIFFQFRMTTRLGLLLLVVNVGVLSWVAWNEWIRHLRSFNPLLVALDIEEKHPQLSSLLVSYTQLEGVADDQPDVSAELIEAMREQAVIETKKLDFREIVNFGQLRNLLLTACGVVMVFGVASFVSQGHLSALAKRLAGLDASYPTQTTISKVDGDLIVRAGDPVPISATVTGVVPDRGFLYFKPADGTSDWKEVEIVRAGNGSTFSKALKNINKDSVYYMRIGDDQSAEHRIRVVAAPQVIAKEVAITYPGYMKKDAGKVNDLNLEVPKGTELTWRIESDTALASLRVIRTEIARDAKQPESLDATLDESRKVATFHLTANRAFKYEFVWTEKESGRNFTYKDVQNNVRVTTDSLPRVQLRTPRADGFAIDKKVFKMTAEASDDYGLSQAWFVYAIDGSEETRIDIKDFQGLPSGKVEFTWPLKKLGEKLKLDSTISVAIEVSDLNPNGERRRRSATRHFRIVDTEEYKSWFRRQFAATRAELKEVRENQDKSSKAVQQLKEQETKK